MESAPPPISTAALAAAIPATYPDSVDSSPRSRNTDSWDDPALPTALHSKLRLMCSYGGTIVPRPHDKVLCYIGGDTRMVVVDRHTTLASLHHRLSLSLLRGCPFTLKYQLPSEDLDSLISVTTDEDLENMIDEYDRTCSQSTSSSKSSRIRLFLFPFNPDGTLASSHSIGPIINNSTKSDEWFLNALNGSGLLNRGFSDPTTNVNLLGLDEDRQGNVVEVGSKDEGSGSQKNMNLKSQDVHSVPDSPMLETTSSFGSTSSSPSLANLPPIRVRAEDQKEHKVGIEEQFAQFTVTASSAAVVGVGVKQQDEVFAVLSSPPPMPVGIPASGGGVVLNSGVVPGEYTNRVLSDDERSDHGIPVGYRKVQIPQSQSQPPQNQQKYSSGQDLASPDSISSDSSFTNPLSRPKPVVLQDPVVQIPSGANSFPANTVDPKLNISDPNTIGRLQIQQSLKDSGYVLQQHQFEQQQHQFEQQQQHPLQQQQFLQATAAAPYYIHHHPSGAVPISAYYPVYHSQQQQQHLHHQTQIDQQYPLYYVSARQPQTYSMPVQQPSISEAPTGIPSSRLQTPSNPTMAPTHVAYNPMRNAPLAKPEMTASTGLYRTSNTGNQQLVQVQNSQHHQQYVGYSQIHHPSQSVAPTSAATAQYAHEITDPAHAQMYYTQPLAPTNIPSQYQTMTGVVLPDASAQLPTDNIKSQIRTSQPI
ncbi:elongator complex protein 2-like isoform X1 [Hibiscus syriacus]|uniref:Elongator complex protein 2-like isoform X1 n=1 Tax=Hibiscus syriacus TaxID=106335 RepID=A0A6A2ZK46_HIBSY|nr:dual specificity protein kinase splA-like [Hibiscus syriacus]KAE8692331.1 elongator complex protein 2-like isoform X1 [Hibiscus syriacus]